MIPTWLIIFISIILFFWIVGIVQVIVAIYRVVTSGNKSVGEQQNAVKDLIFLFIPVIGPLLFWLNNKFNFIDFRKKREITKLTPKVNKDE